MKIKKLNILPLFLTSIFFITSCGNNLNLITPYQIEKLSDVSVNEPLTLLMPTTNYNERPDNIDIDSIIIHHTAPFASLTRVGYFFQDVNSRVSAHYTIGKEGIIIQSLDNNERGWHGGPSSYLGKYNVNDYSIGIELLNDGDHKDPFTEPQYNSLAFLVAYLMKKYDVPISRVVGHRHIAFPTGRKIDPADNFDWKLFKSKIRTVLKQPQKLFGWGDLPEDTYFSSYILKKGLKSDDSNIRGFTVDNFLTMDFKPYEGEIEETFISETDPIVKSKFFRLFSIYKNNKFLEQAKNIFKDKASTDFLKISALNYIYSIDKDNMYELLKENLEDKTNSDVIKSEIIGLISNYKNDSIEGFLKDIYKNTDSLIVKNSLLQNLWKFNNDDTKNIYLNSIKKSDNKDLRITSIENSRLIFDKSIENELLNILKDDIENDKFISLRELEEISWVLIRKDSLKGIKYLTNEYFYNRLTPKLKIGLINTIAKLNLQDYQEWLRKTINNENDKMVLSSLYLSLGRIKTKDNYSFLYNELKKKHLYQMNYVILKSISNYYEETEVKTAIKTILNSDIKTPYQLKALAVSTIKENNLKEYLPDLIKAINNSNEKDLNIIIKEAVSSLNTSK